MQKLWWTQGTCHRHGDAGAHPLTIRKKGKDPHPQDKSQYLDFTKDPRPLYYKTPPCALYHKMSVVRPFSVLSKDEMGP